MKKNILPVFFILFCIFGISTEALHSPAWGYSLDLPENFVLADRKGNTRYLFQHSILPVDLQIALYSKDKFANPEQVSENIFLQMKMKHKDVPFTWQNKSAILSIVEFEYAPSEKFQKKKLAGWLLTIELPNDKGNLALLSYTDAEKAKECEPLMISSLDMIFTNSKSYFSPGPVTTALYPKTGEEKIDYLFNSKKINFKIDKSDAEANKSVVEREFKLLTIYLNKKNVFEAWKRYYRVIFRDAWSRVKDLSLAVQMAYPELMGEKGIDSKKTAELVLKFVQDFNYIRDKQGSDFINLPQAFMQKKGDCDTRALLMTLMLKQMNIDSILLISQKKQHSLAAVDCTVSDKTAKYFKHTGQYYIMAETTAKVKLGELDNRLKNGAEWFVVDFYLDAYFSE